SPALIWEHTPGTRSFAVFLDHHEARGGDGFIHWALYEISATATSLPANAGVDLPTGGRHAYKDFLQRSYGGPARPRARRTNSASACSRSTCRPSTTPARPMTWRELTVHHPR